jgi:hypothetical protein
MGWLLDNKIETKVVHDQLCSVAERYPLSSLSIIATFLFFSQFIWHAFVGRVGESMS